MFLLFHHCYIISLEVSNISTLIYLLISIAVSQTLELPLAVSPLNTTLQELQAYLLSALLFLSKVATKYICMQNNYQISVQNVFVRVEVPLLFHMSTKDSLPNTEDEIPATRRVVQYCVTWVNYWIFFVCAFYELHTYLLFLWDFFPAICKRITYIRSILGLGI